MNDKIVLVIDDSATIRKLIDTHLSPLGYTIMLAPTAEDGLRLAAESSPDIILLDHQLPGTTGLDVCRQLVGSEKTKSIPVVVSSTLRNRAYAEYSEMPNIVDMLPKPYSPDLLTTTVSNALETGSLIVQSQASGAAVPEVIHAVTESELQGSLKQFKLREVLDFLNNCERKGTLEVESGTTRIWFHLAKGRIQGVTASQVDRERLIEFLPESLRELAPVLDLASARGACAQLDGLVQLLDRKVLDQRLLGKLLRCQAALLVFRCFTEDLGQFSFHGSDTTLPLVDRLPLDVSLIALVVDATLSCHKNLLPADDDCVFVRSTTRGQNLDRSGLAPQHMKLLGLLSEPRSLKELLTRTGWTTEEVARVLHGMTLAGAIDRQSLSQLTHVLALETDATAAQQLRSAIATANIAGKVVRDRIAMQLALRRIRPDLVLVSLESAQACQLANDAFAANDPRLAGATWIAILSGEDSTSLNRLNFQPDGTVSGPVSTQQLANAIKMISNVSPAEPLSDGDDLATSHRRLRKERSNAGSAK